MPLPRSTLLSRGFVALTGATFVLMVLGSVVRAKGAGLSCPDWPLCFGQLIPQFNIQIVLEWGHRVFAGSVTLLLGLMSLRVVRDRGLRQAVGRSLAFAWVLLAVQVVLGGLTVLLLLAPWTVTGHLLVGSTFCATLLWIARDLSEGTHAQDPRPLPFGVSVLLLGVATVLLVQIALGGFVSSHVAGLACAHFPTCDGEAWAPSLHGLVGMHVLHRFGGYTVGLGFLALAIASRKHGRVGTLSRLGLRLVIVQIALGAANVVTRIPVEITALHSAVAAAIVLVTTLLVRDWVRSRSAVPLPSPSMEAVRAR
jgi:cytochrome c oxidase assembly protein subunit 15